MVEGDESLFALPVCSAEARGRIAAVIAAEEARPLTTRDDVDTKLSPLASALPRKASSDTEGEIYLRIATEALADVPADLFVEACRRAARECRFMPTPAELRQLVQRELNVRSWRLMRMRWIVDRHDREGGPPPPEPMVDPGEVTALLASIDRSLVAKGQATPMPSAPAPRLKGPPRLPTAQDYADTFGISLADAEERIRRSSEDQDIGEREQGHAR